MARLKKFRGNFMVHKHRGNRWTVRVHASDQYEVFDWMEYNFGEEDFENGPWAVIDEQWGDDPDDYSTFDITKKEIVTMMALRWQ